MLSEGFAEMLFHTGEKARKMGETKAETRAKALMEAHQIAEMNSKALAIRSKRLPIFSSNPGNIAFVPACPDYLKVTGSKLQVII